MLALLENIPHMVSLPSECLTRLYCSRTVTMNCIHHYSVRSVSSASDDMLKLRADCHCRHYHAHVRSHFMTNMGVAGGLILLQSFGA